MDQEGNNMNKSDRDTRSSVDNNPMHPFIIPEGYFEEFKKTMMEKVRQESSAEKRVMKSTHPLLRGVRPYLLTAAVVAAFALVFSFFPKSDVPSGGESIATFSESLSEEEYQQFLLEETTQDYWGSILLESEEDEVLYMSSLFY